jgi:hypothetical protein
MKTKNIPNLGSGIFETNHFNMDLVLKSNGFQVEGYPDLGPDVGCYGVVDSPAQFVQKFGPALHSDPRRFVVSLTRIIKAEEPAEDGWRWEKWGDYYGDKKPQCQYLYDEDDSFPEVWCFHVHEIKD